MPATARRGFIFWGAEVKAYPVQEPSGLSGYIATTTAAKCGLPYEWNAAGVAQGLLIEEARTNLLTRSQEISNAAWTTGGSTTITADATTAPDGTTTADRLNEDNGAANSYVYSPSATITTAATTWSVFLKGNSRQWIAVHAYDGANRTTYFDLTNGVVGTNAAGNTASIVDAGNGWWRCIITRTAGTTTGVLNIQAASADNTITAVGDNTKGYYIWGAQIETGSFATSPIHTIGATVTRAVDDISLGIGSFPYSITASTFVTKANCNTLTPTGTLAYLYTLGRQNFSDFIGCRMTEGGSVQAEGVGPGNNASATYNTSFTLTSVNKVGVAFAANDVATLANGGTAVTDNTFDMPDDAAIKMIVGAGEFVGNSLNGHLQQLTYLPRRATNGELQTRTA
jgi:hypothetical protein